MTSSSTILSEVQANIQIYFSSPLLIIIYFHSKVMFQLSSFNLFILVN